MYYTHNNATITLITWLPTPKILWISFNIINLTVMDNAKAVSNFNNEF